MHEKDKVISQAIKEVIGSTIKGRGKVIPLVRREHPLTALKLYTFGGNQRRVRKRLRMKKKTVATIC